MKDIQLRLFKSALRRNIHKTNCICRTWRGRAKAQAASRPFPSTGYTEYISAVELSKTDQAYAAVSTRPRISTDREGKKQQEDGFCVCRKPYTKGDLKTV